MKWFAWSVSIVFILLAFASTVTAQTDDMTSSISVDLQPQYTDANSTEANLMDQTTITLEKDVMVNELNGIEGKYYGPYLQSSLYQFNHEGRYFQFYTNFTIGPDVIMNGASTFWVRVPIVPSQYDQWHVFCSWGYYDILEGNWADYSMGGPQLPWATAFVGPFGVPPNLGGGIYAMPEWWWFNSGYWAGSGNVWNVNSTTGDTYQVLNRDSGLYIEYKGLFHSNEQFTIAFTGLLKENEYPKVFISQERQDLNANQTFWFYDVYGLNPSPPGFKYRAQESLAISAAWAFIFENGIGKYGQVSYKLKFRNATTDYVEWGGDDYDIGSLRYLRYWDETPGYAVDSFISFYIPFSGQLYGEGSAGGRNSINWNIHISLGYGYDHTAVGQCQMYFDRTPYGLADVTSVDFTINETENYLFFSTPYVIEQDPAHGPLNIDDVFVHVRLTPLAQCDIIFLGSDLGDGEYASHNMWADYLHENEMMVHPSNAKANRHLLPLYVNLQWTQSQWAAINETAIYWVYNFGWGVGYHFPGSTRIYLFTDTGGQFFYNGSLAGFVENISKKNTPWYQDLWNRLIKFIGDIFGYIWDGLQAVWNTLVQLGQWVYNTVSSLVGWIISIIKDIANKVSHVIEGMLYGAPMIIILFCSYYAASYLNTGQVPKLGKERRFARRQVRRLRASGSKMAERSRLRARLKAYQEKRRIERKVQETPKPTRQRRSKYELAFGKGGRHAK